MNKQKPRLKHKTNRYVTTKKKKQIYSIGFQERSRHETRSVSSKGDYYDDNWIIIVPPQGLSNGNGVGLDLD